MSAVGKFLQSPFQFMENNILVIGWDGPVYDTLDGRTTEMTFVQKPVGSAIARQLGRNLGLFFVVPKAMVAAMPAAIPDGRTFNAYFCPYQPNKILGTTISNKADYMFTATMDGCSLGIGQAAPDGSRLIYHSNRGGKSDEQRLELGLVMGASLQHVFEPKDYRMEYGQGMLKSTTFGVRSRTSNKWGFYTQIYFEDGGTANPKKYFLRQVKDII